MAKNYSAGRVLQVVANNMPNANGYKIQGGAQEYADIPAADTSITLKSSTSHLYITGYVQGWGNTGNGANMTFKLNGTYAGTTGSNGDTWCRAINGADSDRSFNISRQMFWTHGLDAGTTITISMGFSCWTTNECYAGWSSHPSWFQLTIMEMEALT